MVLVHFIKMVCLLWPLCGTGTGSAQSPIDEAITINLKHCIAQRVFSFEALLNSSHDVTYFAFPEHPNERRDYISESDALTGVNAGLVSGKEHGVPKAKEWAYSTRNNWMVPKSHPRANQRLLCYNVTQAAASLPIAAYKERKLDVLPFYIVKMQSAVITKDTLIGMRCGYWQALEACGLFRSLQGSRWFYKCRASLKGRSWLDALDPHAEGNACYAPTAQHHDTVFVIGTIHDSNFHHIIVESLSRLIHFYDYLQQHPQVMIVLVRESNVHMQQQLLDFLHFPSDRLVRGDIVAKHALFPRAATCVSNLLHALELRAVAKTFLMFAFPEVFGSFTPPLDLLQPRLLNWTLPRMHQAIQSRLSQPRKRLIVQQRFGIQMSNWRVLPPDAYSTMLEAFRVEFSDHEIVEMSDKAYIKCVECQLREYRAADILVGLHGAGLTNAMVMRPGSIVVEIVGKFDGAFLPICGYNGNLNAVFGVHHYIYYYDHQSLKQGITRDIIFDVATQTRAFYNHIYPYLL